MSSQRVLQTAVTAIVTVLMILLAVPSSRAQLALELSIDDVVGYPDGQDIEVSVHMNNYTDTIAGFRLWFQVDKPNMAHFQRDIDTAGTLISGWDVVSTLYENSDSTDLVYFAIAEFDPPFDSPVIPPQSDSLPLLKFRMRVEGNPDPYSAPIVNIIINPFIDMFEFVGPNGEQIGRTYQQNVDTIYFQCLAWLPPDGDVCLDWARVPAGTPFDSMAIITSNVLAINYNQVALNEGSMSIVPGVCGDVDGSFDREVDISDVQRMVDYLFLSLDELPSPMMGNTDGSSDFMVDITDLQVLLSHLFLGMEPIDCGL